MIKDDLSVLTQMVEDMKTAGPLYQPGNYWQVYFDRFYPNLLEEGLSGFRASGHPVYRSMGVSGIPFFLEEELSEYWFSDLTGLKKLIMRVALISGIYRKLTGRALENLSQTFIGFQNALFHLALQTDKQKKLLTIEDSGEGKPRDLFRPENNKGGAYTISFLRYFREYQWVKNFVDFDNLQGILEIGGGYGGQAEVIVKLHPGIRKYVVCDIPPQLYIQEQYLKAVFPDQVTGYLDTRERSQIDLSETKQITVIAPWQLDKVDGSFDLLWNSASFQEMEPSIVENYAKITMPLVKQFVYLKEDPLGRVVASEKGEVGVFKPVLLEDYVRFFSDFSVIHVEDCVHITCSNPYALPMINSSVYDQMIFRRK